MKKLLTLLLALALIVGLLSFSSPAVSANYTQGDYTYTIYDGEVTITSYTGYSTIVNIPATLDGYPVTTIGMGAFSLNESIITVNIPQGVTTLGEMAFGFCTSLTTVTIPESVTSIGSYAFVLCDVLTTINVSSDNPAYTSANGVLFNKSKTKLIQYPCGRTDTTYTIPSSVTAIGEGALMGCCYLTKINVAGGNSSYASADGVLFNKNKTQLIQYPGGKTDSHYTVPSSVSFINTDSFAYCTLLQSVTFPGSVTAIGGSAFYLCISLTTVTIPDSVTIIGEYAFYFCVCLTDVYYSGSETARGKMKINDGNDALMDATWHYGAGNSETTQPTTQPTTKVTTSPTTIKLTTQPTTKATTKPTTKATTKPTTMATTRPTTKPTTRPTTKPTTRPTTATTTKPTTIFTTTVTTSSAAVTTTTPTTEPEDDTSIGQIIEVDKPASSTFFDEIPLILPVAMIIIGFLIIIIVLTKKR